MLDNLLPASPLRRYLLLNEGAGGDGGGTGGGGDEPRFTQADMDRVAGRARADGRSTAVAEFTEQLGGKTPAEAKAALEAKAEADNAALTDAERARNEAAADRAAAANEKAAAAAERLAVKVERKLIAAGVGTVTGEDPDGKKAEAAAAALARAVRLVTLAPDADDTAIDTEIAAVKADVPALFTPTGAGSPPPAGSNPPPPPPPPGSTGGGTKTMAERGQEALRKAGIKPREAA